MVGTENRPHTRRMTLLRTTISKALFQFALSHWMLLLGSSEDSESSGFAALIVDMLELVEAPSKLSIYAVCFASILTVKAL